MLLLGEYHRTRPLLRVRFSAFAFSRLTPFAVTGTFELDNNRRFSPSRSVLDIVAWGPNGYHDAQNRRSYGEFNQQQDLT